MQELSNSWQKVGLMKEAEFAALRETQRSERVRTIEQQTELVVPPTPPVSLSGEDSERDRRLSEEWPPVLARKSEQCDEQALSKSLPTSLPESERRTQQSETENVALNRQTSQPVSNAGDKARFYAVPPKAQIGSRDEENRVDKVCSTVWLATFCVS